MIDTACNLRAAVESVHLLMKVLVLAERAKPPRSLNIGKQNSPKPVFFGRGLGINP